MMYLIRFFRLIENMFEMASLIGRMELKLFALMLSIFMVACCDSGSEDFEKTCPYEMTYWGHYLRIPITISPHQMTYKVGDSIQINTIFSDSIYDLGTQQTFQIREFPFKPISLLYRFTNDSTYDSGYRVNELVIDSSYRHVYNYSSNYADGFRAYTIYNGERYSFESTLILKEPGRYILVFSDLYEEHSGSGNPELNAEADAITFEGKCPTLEYSMCNMIDSGDDHLQFFEPELVYLDKEVYRDGLRYRGGNALDALYPGAISVEFAGFFGFEVKE